jgi:hypothetical protein
LDNLQIAAPSDVGWESMTGDERTRICALCNKNVYNISQMSKKEANEFLYLTNHNACVSFFQRIDGTIITDNCPRGLKKLRDRYRKIAASISSLLALAYSFLLSATAAEPIANINDESKAGEKSATKRLGGKPVAQSIRGEPLAPMSMGGAPIPNQTEPASMANYRQYIKNSLIEAMPKNVDFGDAAISLAIDKQGKIVELRFIKHSPKMPTDKLILSAIEGIKFKPMPKDNNLYGYLTVRTYFECRCAQ